MRQVLPLLLSGCLGWDVGETITPVWKTADDKLWWTAVEHAADSWTEVLGPTCPFPFPIAVGGTHITLVPASDWDHDSNADGWTSYDRIDVRDSGTGPFRQRAILAHEFGHAFGLSHSKNADSIMHRTINYMQVPLPSDGVDARDALGCR